MDLLGDTLRPATAAQAALKHGPPLMISPAASASTQTWCASPSAALLDDPNLSEADREKLLAISELLDERVRPYLQGDGGDLYIVGLEGNELRVHYQGACGSCPSSLSGTLSGIESLVHQVDPSLEVVPV